MRVLSRLVALSFAVTAVFHAFALVSPTISEPSSPWRHALFIGITLFFAASFWRRTWWLPFAYVVLAVQQSYSHGVAFAAAYAVGHTDWQSVVALAPIPLFAWVAYKERGARVPRLPRRLSTEA